jgi:hypothetical protein
MSADKTFAACPGVANFKYLALFVENDALASKRCPQVVNMEHPKPMPFYSGIEVFRCLLK